MDKERIEFIVPAEWKRKLRDDCDLQDLSMNQLMNNIVKEFLRGVYYVGERFVHKEKKKNK